MAEQKVKGGHGGGVRVRIWLVVFVRNKLGRAKATAAVTQGGSLNKSNLVVGGQNPPKQ